MLLSLGWGVLLPIFLVFGFVCFSAAAVVASPAVVGPLHASNV